MKLSVIIPCKNEETTIRDLLDSLAQQSRPADEIIIIDSHSTDDTVRSAKQYQKTLPLRIVTAKKKGVAHARNEGAEAATGELFMFIDADVILPPSCLEIMVKDISRRKLSVGGFSQRMRTESRGLSFSSRLMNGYVRTMSLTPWPIFFSCFFATKKVHQAIGGFDTTIWIMEDYDYAYRARRAGAKFGLIRHTFFSASPRRFDEGHSIGRAVYAEIYRYTHGLRITKPLFSYEMGGRKSTSKKSN